MQAWVLIWLFVALSRPLLVIFIIHNLFSNESESDGRSPYCFHVSGIVLLFICCLIFIPSTLQTTPVDTEELTGRNSTINTGELLLR